MGWFGAKDNEFFRLLDEQADGMLLAANKLKELIEKYNDFGRNERKAFVLSINPIKIKSDEITISITNKAGKNSGIPYNKEDSKRLAVLLDNATCLIELCASRLLILGIQRINEHISKFAEAAAKLAGEIKGTVSELKNINKARGRCARIYELAKETDELFDDALSEVFHFYKNPIDVMRYREIYDIIKSMSEKCRDIAKTVEGIASKNS